MSAAPSPTSFFTNEERGRLIVDKVPSMPVDPSQGVHAGTARLDFDLAKLVHGTTVATTTIIERKGARTAVLTTAGFRDVLEDLQKAAGHRDPSTTKLYDRCGYNPEKAASFFATS
jgi:N-methylhydantoinase A/oxoprolinase/acetone carboxylase beta subunit